MNGPKTAVFRRADLMGVVLREVLLTLYTYLDSFHLLYKPAMAGAVQEAVVHAHTTLEGP